MNTRSISLRLVSWYAGLLAAIFLVLCALLYFNLRHFLINDMRESEARHARQAPQWKGMVASLGSQLGALGERVAAQQTAHETAAAQIRQTVSALEATAGEYRAHAASATESVEAVRSSVSSLEDLVQSHGRAIRAIEAAVTQTDEVMEHVVEAFDQMHRSMVEHEEAKAFSVSGNGS